MGSSFRGSGNQKSEGFLGGSDPSVGRDGFLLEAAGEDSLVGLFQPAEGPPPSLGAPAEPAATPALRSRLLCPDPLRRSPWRPRAHLSFAHGGSHIRRSQAQDPGFSGGRRSAEHTLNFRRELGQSRVLRFEGRCQAGQGEPRRPFPVPLLGQGCGGGPGAQPDGAPGGGAGRERGADADGAVPHAPGHHAVGLRGPVPRAAHGPPFRGGPPPAVSDLSCPPRPVLLGPRAPESPVSPEPRAVKTSESPPRPLSGRGEGPGPGELHRGARSPVLLGLLILQREGPAPDGAKGSISPVGRAPALLRCPGLTCSVSVRGAGTSPGWPPRRRRASPCCSWTRPAAGSLNSKRRTTSLRGTLVSLLGQGQPFGLDGP